MTVERERDSDQGHTPRSGTFPPFIGVFSPSFFEFARIKREKDVKTTRIFHWAPIEHAGTEQDTKIELVSVVGEKWDIPDGNWSK